MRYVFFLLFLSTSAVYSQIDEELHRSAPGQNIPVIFEAIPYWSEDTTAIDLVVYYRIHSEFFFFAKTHSGLREFYEAKGELVFEISDDKNTSIKREIRPILIERNSMPEEGVPFSDEIHGVLTFQLKRGLFQMIVEAKDIESNKSFVSREMKIDTRTIVSGVTISPIIFIEAPSQNAEPDKSVNYIPLSHGGNIIVGQSGGCLLQITSPDTLTDLHLSWKVTSTNDQDEDFPQELHGEKFFQEFGTPLVMEMTKRVTISLKKGSKCSRLVYIPMPIEHLETGKYQMSITVHQGQLNTSKDFPFTVLWPLKPRSLSDFKLAVDAVRHIATDAELDSMTAFSSAKSMKAFRSFWRRRNPDPTRAYNPSLAEYYRRVDESIKRFSSSNEIDGYRTDRGRIFILFGSPSFTNRLLKPNSAPTEIWTYETLKRRFVFTDQQKTGNYTLTKMENY